MDAKLQQYLQTQRGAIRQLLAHDALPGDHTFVQCPLQEQRHHTAQYTEVVIQALRTGALARPAIDALRAQVIHGEVRATDLLAQVATTYGTLEHYFRQGPAADEAVRTLVLARMDRAYGQLMRELVTCKLARPREHVACGAVTCTDTSCVRAGSSGAVKRGFVPELTRHN